MAEALTMNLRLQLEKTSAQFSRWANSEKTWLESNDANYRQKIEEFHVTINALKENEYELDSSKSMYDAIKKQQQAEIEQCTAQNGLLTKQREVLEQQLRRCEDDEANEVRRLEEARGEHEALRRKMEQALNDLIYGMRHYIALGLEFQKADGDCIKFTFTQIQESDPNRKFSFVMFVDAHNQYQLVETMPALDRVQCLERVNKLNISNDIGRFVTGMRKLFKNHVAQNDRSLL
jgi:DNA-binding transcriptional MerR regulator